jgi:hypothetical protein
MKAFQERKLILFIAVFLILSDSCNKKEIITVCGVENPGENIEWLNSMTKGLICDDIYKYIFEGKEYIVISSGTTASDLIDNVYDCEGTLLCSHGGKFPGTGCNLSSSFWESYKSQRILLYQINNLPKI